MKRNQKDMGLQPYIISISKENYQQLEKLKIEGGFPSRNDLITELLKQVKE